MTTSPLDLACRVAELLESLGIPYALGGSLASSMFGEPRSTLDVDIAIAVAGERGEALLERASAEFVVPLEAARTALESHSSFNLLAGGLKVDLFVLGDDLLDRIQIERRRRVAISDGQRALWVTAPEVQVLRKLDWYRQTEMTSERQWRDVIGLLTVARDDLDLDLLRRDAAELGLADLLRVALDAAGWRP